MTLQADSLPATTPKSPPPAIPSVLLEASPSAAQAETIALSAQDQLIVRNLTDSKSPTHGNPSRSLRAAGIAPKRAQDPGFIAETLKRLAVPIAQAASESHGKAFARPEILKIKEGLAEIGDFDLANCWTQDKDGTIRLKRIKNLNGRCLAKMKVVTKERFEMGKDEKGQEIVTARIVDQTVELAPWNKIDAKRLHAQLEGALRQDGSGGKPSSGYVAQFFLGGPGQEAIEVKGEGSPKPIPDELKRNAEDAQTSDE